MKVTLLQQNIVWGDRAANQQMAEKALLGAERSDVYVLPEMWSTGFATDPQGVAESDGNSFEWMQRMADKLDAVVAGSIATEANGCFFNRFYFVKPSCKERDNGNAEGEDVAAGSSDGDVVTYYNKRHLFTYGGEHRRYSAGEDRKVVEWRGVKFLLQVCYDLRFPVFSRNRLTENGEAEYDVALYVASWPSSRRAPWDTLLRARAIENQCYVCGVNRVGNDPQCEYNGGTAVIDAYGRTIAACPDSEQSSVSVDIDIERLKSFRKKFPVLADSDL